jgi:hypothetical protein
MRAGLEPAEKRVYDTLQVQCRARPECMQQVWQLCGRRAECVLSVVRAAQVRR